MGGDRLLSRSRVGPWGSSRLYHSNRTAHAPITPLVIPRALYTYSSLLYMDAVTIRLFRLFRQALLTTIFDDHDNAVDCTQWAVTTAGALLKLTIVGIFTLWKCHNDTSDPLLTVASASSWLPHPIYSPHQSHSRFSHTLVCSASWQRSRRPSTLAE